MPALIRSVGAVAGRRLLDERLHPAVVVGGHDAVAPTGRRPRCRAIVASAPRPSWKSTSARDVEVGEHVAVDHDEALVDAGVARGEADGAGGVERLGLDGVVELQRRRTCRRGRPTRRRRAGSRATAPPRSTPCRPRWPSTCSIIGRSTIGSICFGVADVSGRSRVPKPPTRTTARISPSGWWWRSSPARWSLPGAVVPEPGAVVSDGGVVSGGSVCGTVLAVFWSPASIWAFCWISGGARRRRHLHALRARRRSCRRPGPR